MVNDPFLQQLDAKRSLAWERASKKRKELERIQEEARKAELDYETWERAFQNEAGEQGLSIKPLGDNNPETLFPLERAPKPQAASQKEIVFEFMKTLDGNWLNSNDLLKAMLTAGIKMQKHAVQNSLSRLRGEGRIDRDSAGLWFITAAGGAVGK